VQRNRIAAASTAGKKEDTSLTRVRLKPFLLAWTAISGLLLHDRPAQAAVERVCSSGIVTGADNPCTPAIEFLPVVGQLVTTTTTSTNPNGSIHQSVCSRFSGTITESTPQGNIVYRVTGQSHFRVYDSNGAPVLTTILDDLQAITPGPVPNFVIHSNIQFVVSATGATTVQSFNQTATCQGSP
jgi:hypothetical protein